MVRVSFDQLRQQIEHSTTVQKSAVELIRGLADKIAEIGTHPTPEEMEELANQLRAHAGELANAIALHEGHPEEPDEPDEPDEEDERHR